MHNLVILLNKQTFFVNTLKMLIYTSGKTIHIPCLHLYIFLE